MYNRFNVHTISRLVKPREESFQFMVNTANFNERELVDYLGIIAGAIWSWKILQKYQVEKIRQLGQISLELINKKLYYPESHEHMEFLCDLEARFRVGDVALSVIETLV
jgi:hypothetical protein